MWHLGITAAESLGLPVFLADGIFGHEGKGVRAPDKRGKQHSTCPLCFSLSRKQGRRCQADSRVGLNSIIVSCMGVHLCHLETRHGVDRPLLRLQAGQGQCWDNRGHGRWTGSQRRNATPGTRWCGDMRKRHRVSPLWNLDLKIGLMKLKIPQTISVVSGGLNLMGPLQINKQTKKQNLSSDPHNGRCH